eukprot:scaffold165759_cov23-Tisochrysis_lutea.AAC.3
MTARAGQHQYRHLYPVPRVLGTLAMEMMQGFMCRGCGFREDAHVHLVWVCLGNHCTLCLCFTASHPRYQQRGVTYTSHPTPYTQARLAGVASSHNITNEAFCNASKPSDAALLLLTSRPAAA